MFESVAITAGGPQLAADLYIPKTGKCGYPGVIAGSGFGGVKEMLLPVFAEALAEAGIATLLIDFAGFGASKGHPRQHVDPASQIRDLRRALDYLAQDKRVDGNRLGVYGPSMCGAHALVIAGTDPRIRAAVSIIPFVQAPATPPSLRIGLTLAAEVMRRACGLAPRTIATAGLPGERAAMTNDGALNWVETVSRNAPRFRNEVTIESLLRVARYRPLRLIGSAGIRIPLRTILATDDAITPAANARAVLGTAPHHDLVEFPGTHFDLFGEHLQGVVGLTVDWFRGHLAHPEQSGSYAALGHA